MKANRKELEVLTDKILARITFNNEDIKNVCNKMDSQYNIPKGITMDIISARTELSSLNDFMLFTIVDSLDVTMRTPKKYVNQYFTEQEVKTYSNSKYEVDTIKFPIVLDMSQVRYDQWIGSIDFKFLMELRKAQLINYNKNAQRTMQKIVHGDKESYKIALNKKSVAEIKEALENDTFISNTITLNIEAENENNDFYFDKENHALVIKSLDHFDILDGYHRYIAGSQVSESIKDWNYEMELRIVNFSEDKAKQFVFQEDQKTKMRKLDSDAMNMTKGCNIVAERLNDDTKCNICGLISRNEGLIPYGEFALLVDYLWFKGVGKKDEKKVIVDTVKELRDKFNALTETNTMYLTNHYTFTDLCIILYGFKTLPDDVMCEKITQAIQTEPKDEQKFYSKVPRKSLFDTVEKMF